MKWLVFGASSFSGSHLVRYLREKRHQVEERSLRQYELPLPTVDVLINFAALNVVAPSWAHWREYMHVNVLQTGNLFEAMVDNPPGLYIHVSTPEVYGSAEGKLDEAQPFNPSTPYAVSRATAEMMLKTYERQYGLKAIVTRACNVYGPGQQHYRLIPKLVVSIKKGVKFPLEGGGTSRRAWVYIDDLCRAYELLARYGQPGEAYHISSPKLYNAAYIVSHVCYAMDAEVKSVVEHVPERPGKDPEYWLDSKRINDIGWEPQVKLADGIGKTVAWMQANWENIKDKPMEYEVRP